MSKAKAKKTDVSPRDDPRVRDVALEHRYKLAAASELLHEAYVCPLWLLERTECISPEQRRAGDEYERAVLAGRRALDWDIDRFPDEKVRAEMEKECQRKRKKWEDARSLLRMGPDGIKIQLAVDDLCLDHIYPATEKEKFRIKIGLTKLAYFFGLKNKSST